MREERGVRGGGGGSHLKLKDGIAVLGTYSAMHKSKTIVDILKKERDNKVFNLSYMKLELSWKRSD